MLSSPATLFINHSYIRPVKGETAASLVKDNELINIPKNTVNGGVTWKYNALITGNLYASWHDSIKSPIGTTATTYRYDPDYEIPAGTTLNLAVSAQDVYQGVALSFKVHNLLDKRDWRGGTVRIPYPQEGRSIMIELRYSP